MAEPLREAGNWPKGPIPFSFNAYTYSGINSLGHGMGYNFGEPPGVNSGVQTELKPGMLLCVHPNYFAGFELKYTVGDTFLLTENGSEALGKAIPLTPGLRVVLSEQWEHSSFMIIWDLLQGKNAPFADA